ncbi:FG-GAP repeat protein, partial [Polyangium fumosum]
MGSDRFGCAVALSGNTALVGARSENAKGTESGSAYVF